MRQTAEDRLQLIIVRLKRNPLSLAELKDIKITLDVYEERGLPAGLLHEAWLLYETKSNICEVLTKSNAQNINRNRMSDKDLWILRQIARGKNPFFKAG
jgi:hypothetical protein